MPDKPNEETTRINGPLVARAVLGDIPGIEDAAAPSAPADQEARCENCGQLAEMHHGPLFSCWAKNDDAAETWEEHDGR